MSLHQTVGPDSVRALLASGVTCIRTESFSQEIATAIDGMRLLTENEQLARSFESQIVADDLFDPEYQFDAGLWRREDKHERKWFCHVIPMLDTRVRSLPAELRAFGDACTALADFAKQHGLRLASEIDAIGVHAVQDAQPDAPENRFAVVVFLHTEESLDEALWWQRCKPRFKAFEDTCLLKAA